VTELDQTGDPDDARPSASSGGGATAGPEGRTQVIGDADRTRPVGAGTRPAVPVPAQAGPSWAEHGQARTRPVRPGHGAPTGFPPAEVSGASLFSAPPTTTAAGGGYGPPAGYGAPAHPAAHTATHTATYGAPGHPTAHGAPSGWPTGPGYPPPGVDLGAPGAAPPSGRPRGLAALVALVAIVGLVAGGVVAYLSLRGGGGDTPAEATRLLAGDLQSSEWGRALTRLHPAEVALGSDLGGVLRDELVRLEVVRADADPATLLAGATFTDLRFDDTAVDQVRPNVAIAKLIGGTITLDRDVDALPLTDSYRRLAYPNGVPPARSPEVVDIARVVADQGRPVRVATVEVDGAWYVSLTYSLADLALVQEGEAWPQGSVAARGAATPQDALRESVSALFAQDARRLVELAPPGELAVVHDVGPLLVENAGTPQPTVRLVELASTASDVPGGTALAVDRLVAEDDGGARVTVVRDGDCLSVTETRSYGGGAPARLCADDLANQGVGSLPGSTDPAVRDVVERVARAALALRVVVVEDEGQYYVSPTRTMAGLGIDVLRTLQPADLARLAEAAE
jgi:hypothetical protein